jgi:hypothetical protein
MSDGIVQEKEGDSDQLLDVQRLIEAVRGSQVARVLFEFRPWQERHGSSHRAKPQDRKRGRPAR